MKLAKRSIAIVAAMSFIASMGLTGCGDKAAQQPATTEETTAEAPAKETVAENTEKTAE